MQSTIPLPKKKKKRVYKHKMQQILIPHFQQAIVPKLLEGKGTQMTLMCPPFDVQMMSPEQHT